MTRWVLAMTFVAIGCKKSECPTATTEALDAVTAAITADDAIVNESTREAQREDLVFGAQGKQQERLEARLVALEEAMGCKASPDDCCEKLETSTAVTRGPIEQAATEARANIDVPPQVVDAMAPMIAMWNDADTLGVAQPSEVVAWCTKSRQLIAQFRIDAPNAWTAAKDAQETLRKKSQTRIDAATKRLAVLRPWKDALAKSAAVTISDDAPPAVRESLEKYQRTCH